MIEEIVSILGRHWPIAISILFVAWLAKNYFNHGLNKYPGPLLAGLTNWWRFLDVYGRRPDITQLKLHRQHGDIVRLGPNVLSFSDPKAIKQIYGLNKGFVKVSKMIEARAQSNMIQSGFYPVQMGVSQGKRLPSLFSTTDEGYHANLRRSVNSAFSMSTLVQYEPLVNEATEVFLDQTERLFARTNKACDFAEWLQYFAFDVIGQLTYSKRHGFVEKAEDIDGMIGYLGRLFSYVAPVGQMPWLDLLFLKNPLVLWLDKVGFTLFKFPITTFAKTHIDERLREIESNKAQGIDESTGRADLLSMFLKAKKDRPDFFTDQRVLTMAVSMAFAGSETTAISLAATFYYLLRNPTTYAKLTEELDTAVRDGKIENRPNGLVSWTESQDLPYLDACIKESMRLHPAPGLPLERVTPPSGIEICGSHIPGGTIVGCNAWVVHKRPEVFGSDVDAFRPERWLEAGKEQLKEMNASMLQFGSGARTCIGKNISLLEMYKLVPAFMRRFDIEFADASQPWVLHNAWFVKQKNFYTRFTAKRTA